MFLLGNKLLTAGERGSTQSAAHSDVWRLLLSCLHFILPKVDALLWWSNPWCMLLLLLQRWGGAQEHSLSLTSCQQVSWLNWSVTSPFPLVWGYVACIVRNFSFWNGNLLWSWIKNTAICFFLPWRCRKSHWTAKAVPVHSCALEFVVLHLRCVCNSTVWNGKPTSAGKFSSHEPSALSWGTSYEFRMNLLSGKGVEGDSAIKEKLMVLSAKMNTLYFFHIFPKFSCLSLAWTLRFFLSNVSEYSLP